MRMRLRGTALSSCRNRLGRLGSQQIQHGMSCGRGAGSGTTLATLRDTRETQLLVLKGGVSGAGGSRGYAGRAVVHYASFVVGLVAEDACDALDLLDDAAPALGPGVGDAELEEPLDLRPPALDR